MKTTLTIFAAVVMPGGFIVLAVAVATYLIARRGAGKAQRGEALAA